ncbi:unnamed protein product [Chilo suppressalis]|uniref:Uncharacterized protein n=1 Tax=Chilo suppressalis TaxID=168631 RepID=A0ABN8EC09_CHISP|nr:hypothetical protein evm_013026 [Chilo suppressalis]CAH0684477.1 unnamed protein product [Chilo suppressalis]
MKTLMACTMVTCILEVVQCTHLDSGNTTNNSTAPTKDMYVINALVYQVGIITNKTGDKNQTSSMGNQEAITLYRTNGSKIDLSNIPEPLLTNVTAQSMVQVAPKDNSLGGMMGKPLIAWNDLKHLTVLPEDALSTKSNNIKSSRVRRNNFKVISAINENIHKMRNLFKRELSGNKTTVEVVKGAVVVPQATGVQSIAIPPLMALNNNLSSIPVPIPNTSIVHYARINTLVRHP